MDGDMDVPGADAEDTDGDMGETAATNTPASAQIAEADTVLSAAAVAEADPEDSAAPVADDAPPAAPEPAADPHTEQEEPAVSEPTIPAVEPSPAAATTPAGVTLSDDQFAQLLAAMRPAPAMAAAEAAPAAPVVESAPVAAESDEQRIARLVAEGVAAAKASLIQDFVEEGRGPVRKGLVRPVSETGPVGAGDGELNEYGVPSHWPNKPLHEYNQAERSQYFGPALQDHVLKERAVY
jgi:hypothetical protein